MGLFGDGDKCAFCGKESGFLGGLFGYTLKDGAFMCSDCRAKCTPNENMEYGEMTVDDIRANMAVAKANRKKGTEQFKATRTISTGRYRDRALLKVDEKHGWFMRVDEKDGWVYSLDDVFCFNLVPSYAALGEDESFYLNSYEYPELPECPEGLKVEGAKLAIWFAGSELGVEKLLLDLVPAVFPDADDVRGGYVCAHEFFDCVKDYRSDKNK